MQFIINEKILSLPPYVSTSWDHIASVHAEGDPARLFLILSLHNGTLIKIPNLSEEVLEKIFRTHSRILAGTEKKKKEDHANPFFGVNPVNAENMVGLGFPMKFGVALEGLGAAMQHNPSQSDAPNLPPEVLEKISAVSKIMGADRSLSLELKPEPHCNCTHCQIARALKGDLPASEAEEPVTEEDLRFKTWDIIQSGDRLYTVTNPLDDKEQYSVYLGEPLGCTCGQKSCEHIKAVLNT